MQDLLDDSLIEETAEIEEKKLAFWKKEEKKYLKRSSILLITCFVLASFSPLEIFILVSLVLLPFLIMLINTVFNLISFQESTYTQRYFARYLQLVTFSYFFVFISIIAYFLFSFLL